jgi:dTDP-4-amino-4,6-dideoxygalactose transaminase
MARAGATWASKGPRKTSALIGKANSHFGAQPWFLCRTLPVWLISVNSDILRKSFFMTTVSNLGHALAISGGAPVRTDLFPPWPALEEEEIEAAAAVLRSGRVNYWTGDEGRAFEREFAAFTGRKYAIALANGTVALELALYSLDIGPGDEVVVPSRTFIASASCAVMRGATPVVADIDRDSSNLTAETIKSVITSRTKAIVAVHLAGWPCDMESILELAHRHRIAVIEDCAQAHGARYRGRSVGSFGEMAAFSFCQDKNMTTGGEGGMLLTNDRRLWNLGWSFKDHGKSFEAVYERHHPPGYRFLHESFGTNWRLTEAQSAIGRVLLRKLPGMVEKRRRNAAFLSEEFSRIPALRVVTPPDYVWHAYYKYDVYIRPERLREGWDRNRIQEAISAEGIPCTAGTCSEIYLEKAFPESMRPRHLLPVARELGETSLMFKVHPTLSERDLADTCMAVSKIMQIASRD